MLVGVIKEIKDKENRVALTPSGAAALVQSGHTVCVESSAGSGSGFSDEAYQDAGAQIVPLKDAWGCELVLKVKEPLTEEYRFLNGQMVFTFFHLAGVDIALTNALLSSKTTAIAYESVEDNLGRLPLLAPMSAVAGSMSVTMGNYFLAQFNHGTGTLLGKVLGESHGKVVIIGDGIVGKHAGRVAAAMGAKVFICGRHEDRLPQLKKDISKDIRFVYSSEENITTEIQDADLVVGAVLLRGAKAPHVVTKKMVKQMQTGAVIVDVSIDQGGCIETSRPTSHTSPVFEKYGVLHYCVTNMPGAYPRTSTIALTSATLPYVKRLADDGVAALRKDTAFANGVNTWKGNISSRAVADALNMSSCYQAFR